MCTNKHSAYIGFPRKSVNHYNYNDFYWGSNYKKILKSLKVLVDRFCQNHDIHNQKIIYYGKLITVKKMKYRSKIWLLPKKLFTSKCVFFLESYIQCWLWNGSQRLSTLTSLFYRWENLRKVKHFQNEISLVLLMTTNEIIDYLDSL